MSVMHEPWLVALSLLMAFQGSFVGLNLAVQVGQAAAARRRMLLAGAALTLSLGIWSMHFVGMLAARLPVAVDFLVLPTLLSFLVCVLVVGIAVFAASNARLTPTRLGLAAFV
ncbi:MAG: MHYT domain-containing protein, partial [Roseibium sp.]|uniref:MHYT domain-containing protein n=1 Tax=Roseibium sp. TaxID=1936156 RepID=UPI0032970FCD